VLTPMAFQALMVTIRLTSAATCCGLNSAATSWCVRAGLEGALRDAIRAGRLRAGTRLPSSRALAAVLELPRTSLEHAALSGASEHGVAIDGLGHYRAGGAGPDDDGHRVRSGLVIGYGRPPEHAYTTALARLCAVLADLL
jgi:DNA-binding transcriptional MocR family regulator